jgi:cytochrome c
VPLGNSSRRHYSKVGVFHRHYGSDGSLMEANKFYAAILVAGILAMISIIGSGLLVAPVELEKRAYPIEGVGQAPAEGAAPKPAEVEPVTLLLAKADPDHGAQIAKQCQACHNFAKGGPDMVGPNLWGVLGGPHAHKQGYAYSEAMEHFPGTWDYESVNKFIAKPSAYLAGTKMGFAGLKKPQDRADVIAWLRQQSDSPLPLPPAEPAK